MTKVIPASRYVPLTQQRWCCVPTCIQIVMLRHKIPLLSAELIGSKLGLIVPGEDKKYFWNARTGEKPPAGYGTQAGKPLFSPNRALKSLGIPLNMTWTLIGKLEDYDSFIEYLSKIDYTKDYLVCYDWGTLFDQEYEGGHVCVLDTIDLQNESITIIDPDYNAPKWREVSTRKMHAAMLKHGKSKSGGFWEINLLETANE